MESRGLGGDSSQRPTVAERSEGESDTDSWELSRPAATKPGGTAESPGSAAGRDPRNGAEVLRERQGSPRAAGGVRGDECTGIPGLRCPVPAAKPRLWPALPARVLGGKGAGGRGVAVGGYEHPCSPVPTFCSRIQRQRAGGRAPQRPLAPSRSGKRKYGGSTARALRCAARPRLGAGSVGQAEQDRPVPAAPCCRARSPPQTRSSPSS